LKGDSFAHAIGATGDDNSLGKKTVSAVRVNRAILYLPDPRH
jgi:hypothetical protein